MKWIIASLVLFLSPLGMTQSPQLASSQLLNAIMIVVLALPSIVGVYRWKGLDGLKLFGYLSVFAYAIEYLGLVSGFPYGSFSYGSTLGLKVFGVLPLLLPFSYVPLVLGARVLSKKWYVIAAVLVGTDLVLDPGAVHLGFWSFVAGGWYYSVPLTNFLGWAFSGSIAGVISEKFSGQPPKLMVRSLQLQLAFWSGIAVFSSLWIPAVLGLSLYGCILRNYGCS
jgi:putative membrane protein